MKDLIIWTSLTFLGTSLYSQTQSNSHFSESLTTSASPEVIWEIWTTVDQWKAWDTGLKDASMETAFALGAKGSILSLEDRTSRFEVTEFEEGVSYTIKTKLPLGGLHVRRFLEPTGDSTRITHEVWFTGLTGKLFARMFGPKFREMLPEVVRNVERLALERS